jgi:hypothetical protein
MLMPKSSEGTGVCVHAHACNVAVRTTRSKLVSMHVHVHNAHDVHVHGVVDEPDVAVDHDQDQ